MENTCCIFNCRLTQIITTLMICVMNPPQLNYTSHWGISELLKNVNMFNVNNLTRHGLLPAPLCEERRAPCLLVVLFLYHKTIHMWARLWLTKQRILKNSKHFIFVKYEVDMKRWTYSTGLKKCMLKYVPPFSIFTSMALDILIYKVSCKDRLNRKIV